MSASAWIKPYLLRYIDTVGPHDFPDGTDEAELDHFAEGWAFSFDDATPPVTKAEADAARVRLAGPSPEFLQAARLERRPRFKAEHLDAVLAVVRHLRRLAAASARQDAPDPAEAAAAARSRGCPECSRDGRGPTGFANRKGVWRDRSWSAPASLYCRCSLGRLRAARNEIDPPPYDDLQALPHLWDWSVMHASWSDRPAPPPSVEGRDWEYEIPGETAPTPIARAVLPVARSVRRPARSWAGKVPDDLPMPRLARVEPREADEACEGEPVGEGEGEGEGRGA